MDHGVLRINETAEAQIDATKAYLIICASTDNFVFGNAALSASEDLKTVIEKIKQTSDTAEIEVESVSSETNLGMFGKNSSATYTVKLTIYELEKLGLILGICSEGNKITVKSILWDYDDEEEKLNLIKQAIQKAMTKADQMMKVINYSVVGIRSCSDSYHMPNINEVILTASSAETSGNLSSLRMKNAPAPAVDIGVQFKSKRKISATCTVEFLIKPTSV